MTTTSAPLLRRYRNGNCTVSIFADGTKVREIDEGEIPSPRWPESIDLKITDYCDAGCPWCHEKSTVRGVHAEHIFCVTGGLPKGSELAIGGGNPLDYPDLPIVLLNLKHHGLICNLTVNARHLRSHAHVLLQILALETISGPIIHGLGISYNREQHCDVVASLGPNVVVHLIAGVDTPEDLSRLTRDGARKFLILGYKDFGRGVGYRKNLKPSASISRWRYFLPAILSNPEIIVSFDNRGLDQLGVREIVGEDVWSGSYMGDDGQFTMYVDAVRNEYAVSSTSPRMPIGEMKIDEMFHALRKGIK